jgi:curved DNA-binding protein
MEFKDYYQILGVNKTASADDIKKSYRKLARKYHPDISKEPDAAKRMAEVNEANTVLSDPEKRKVYDTVGAQAWAQGARSGDDVRPPPGWNAGGGFGNGGFSQQFGHGNQGDFSDFFEQMFGRTQGGGRGQRRPSGPTKGEDQHAQIELNLIDAYQGGQRSIRLSSVKHDAQGQPVNDTRTLQVQIPSGVKAGQLIRLAGQGHPGTGGAAAGDLFLEVHFKPDQRYHVDGRDVTQRVRVAPWEAALGANIEVTQPNGAAVAVAMPAGSGHGRKLRLKGRGIPHANTPGDLYLEVEIALPGAVTDAQKAAWRNLAAAYPDFDPRRA